MANDLKRKTKTETDVAKFSPIQMKIVAAGVAAEKLLIFIVFLRLYSQRQNTWAQKQKRIRMKWMQFILWIEVSVLANNRLRIRI